ncbi:hypothetical protein FE257_003516 [Aspergillus nanangensis]|uniref:Molybdenum cofactor sulfurase n=1 Tax=Aspergillus nanangensis TaxID=2582783 RepID=A0AAD4GPJ1_ASPNN|nr:hypothetical protein FE257_003516 [Aspergillus nanangensis]
MADNIIHDGPTQYARGYSTDVDVIREREYPQLQGMCCTTYLDHAGTTLYPKSLIDSFSQELTSNLFGNPHSMSPSSQLTTQRVDDIRLRTLRFFNADPEEFDLVFVANATAAIKLVVDAIRESAKGFWYGYHVDSHTSLVGARELANLGTRCFETDDEVNQWISHLKLDADGGTKLFAYPAQSNMNGRRFPLNWCQKIRRESGDVGDVYSLLDAASLVSTSPLDLSDTFAAPDFTVLSFYKIFGFPDLGALIVRKRAGHVFNQRRFFGGGTVDMVLGRDTKWHAKKTLIHERLEDGTLPFHNIIALDSALRIHRRLFGSMSNVSSHTRFMAKNLFDRLAALRHFNGERVCHFYMKPGAVFEDASTQGPILAFNFRSSQGAWIGKSEVERLASVKNIHIRSGTLCNPGGAAAHLDWSGPDMLRHFSAGLRCGDDHDVMDGRPTGILRVSLGAMTNMNDINIFMAFVEEFYVKKTPNVCSLVPSFEDSRQSGFYVESLAVYPIKSCGPFKVPDGQKWEIRREGLAWDREWCLIHQGTGATLNQKRYPRMTLIRPSIDLERGIMRIICGGTNPSTKTLEISLRREDTSLVTTSLCQNSAKSSTVCGDQVIVQAYSSPAVAAFFSDFLGVSCTLARFPPHSSTRYCGTTTSPVQRQRRDLPHMPGSFPQDNPLSQAFPDQQPQKPPILLSNESPILVISRSSVNRLNETIKAGTKKAVPADVFRANIIVAENSPQHTNSHPERPYIEDRWVAVSIGLSRLRFDVLGPCQRCQMVCIDQHTGLRRDEPFSTLAKTRKIGNQVVFGRHAALSLGQTFPSGRSIMSGDTVWPEYEGE